ncbi:MAG: recombinase [Firmicutes bacterium]|nr:recombinase [Bacillota bacterium]
MATVLYPRVSTEDQAEKGNIETQIQFGIKYCDLHEIPLQEIYKDDGVSGTIPFHERPEGSRLIEAAKTGKIKTVLVYKLDRLGRTARVILNAIYDLEQYGVQVRSMTEPFDTSTPAGRFALTILAGVADLDRTTTLERLWLGAQRWAREGKWLGGIVPYGYYLNEDGYLEINENPIQGFDMSEASVIRLIYQLITEQRLSTIKIADYLNALALPPSYVIHGRQLRKGKRLENTSGKWNPGRIRNMIVNSTYMGTHHYGKRSKKDREIITREVPAIISEETWQQAQQVLDDNRLEATRYAKRHYLLRSLVKCNCCGLNFSGTAYPSGKAFYICNGKTTYRGKYQGKCPAKNIPAEWLESMVWQDCVNFIESPGEALATLNSSMQLVKSKKESLESEKGLVLNSLLSKASEKQSIIDLYRKKLIDAQDLEKQLGVIASEKLSLDLRIKELDKLINQEVNLSVHHDTAEQLLTDLRAKLGDEETPYEIKRDIVKTLVRKVVIETEKPQDGNPQASVTVHYMFIKDVLHTDKDSRQQ